MKSKIFAIIVLIIITGAGCTSNVSKNNSTNADVNAVQNEPWLTYRNNEIEFLYPKGYRVAASNIIYIVKDSVDVPDQVPEMTIAVENGVVKAELWEGMEWEHYNGVVESIVNLANAGSVVTDPFTFTPKGVIHFTDKNGKQVVLEPSEPDESMSGYGFGSLSPNKNFLLYAAPVGDGMYAKVYDVATKQSHKLTLVAATPNFGPEWLPDNRLRFYSGCVLQGHCKMYESKSAAKPWEFEFVKNVD